MQVQLEGSFSESELWRLTEKLGDWVVMVCVYWAVFKVMSVLFFLLSYHFSDSNEF